MHGFFLHSDLELILSKYDMYMTVLHGQSVGLEQIHSNLESSHGSGADIYSWQMAQSLQVGRGVLHNLEKSSRAVSRTGHEFAFSQQYNSLAELQINFISY